MRHCGAEDASDVRRSVQRDLPRSPFELLQDDRGVGFTSGFLAKNKADSLFGLLARRRGDRHEQQMAVDDRGRDVGELVPVVL